MKRTLAILFALLGWFAVAGQYDLMIENRTISIPETTLRFFSYFTILTNTLVALYFTCLLFPADKRPARIHTPGTLTAITVYIVMVGSVYQVLLRHIWDPQGLQRVIDEMLHTIIPLLVIVFWYLYETKSSLRYAQVLKWAIYPSVYLVFIMVAGSFSGFYPYHFIDVTKLGLRNALTTSALLLVGFFAIAALFVFVGRRVK